MNSLNIFLTQHLLKLPRPVKIILVILLDIFFSILATWIGLSIRLEKLISFNSDYVLTALIAIGISIPIFFSFGIYKTIFRFSNVKSIQILSQTMSVYAVIYATIFSVISVQGIPRSIGLMQPTILFLLVGGSRWIIKLWLGRHITGNTVEKIKKSLIIYGAGVSGRELASHVSLNNELKLIGFVDDNKSFWGGVIDGHPVFSPDNINYLIEKKNAQQLWLAMPNIADSKRRTLIEHLRRLPIHIQTLPRFLDSINNKVKLTDIRELDINELLGRKQVKANKGLLKKCIFNKTVLVTGAGGSIGAELCKQIFLQKPNYIILIENSEIALYNIYNQLILMNDQISSNNKTSVVPLLADVLNEKTLQNIFETWKPNSVYHAAAYKHVPIVEYNLIAGIQNNVMGTLACAKLSIEHKVDHFVLISTDKAVRPTNVMGATKRLAEMALQSLWNNTPIPHTSICIVRFGNVLGSSGSVVPLFRKQIETGGPITLTDEKVTRYFMTIKEAAQLVIQAGAMAKGCEIFLLDMGYPIRIIDLAKNMIEAAGLGIKDKSTPWGDIEIKITGLRPGEKLYEELLIDQESEMTEHAKILKSKEVQMTHKKFKHKIKELHSAIEHYNVVKIRDFLIKNVNGYSPSADIIGLKENNIKNFKLKKII
jgi:FlaA1/EpsC-like NDP-sugar epimerase